MADLGTVIMPEPEVPFLPVILKVTAVDVADWFVVILGFDICERVMFPLMVRLTVAPLSVVAGIIDAEGFEVGKGAAVGVGFCVGVGLGLWSGRV